MARTVSRIHAAGGATRTRVRDRSRSAGQRARSIVSKLRLRGAVQREEAQSAVAADHRGAGQDRRIGDARRKAVLRNAREACAL